MESPTAPKPPTQGTLARIFAWLTVIGISLSICNELSTLPWQTPGWAILTRSLHAWLGIGALSWVLFRYKPGLWMLVLWILTSLPIIATDPSGNWTKTVFEINTTTESWTRDNGGMIDAYYAKLSRRGINYSPILVALWLIVATTRRAFPVLHISAKRRLPMRLCCLLILSGTLLIITHSATRIIQAPLVLWGSTTGMQFYYKDELLGTQHIRVDADLLGKIGLDNQRPKIEWSLIKHYYTPDAHGIYLTDGDNWARIDVLEPSNDKEYRAISTQWGTRNSPRRRNHNSVFDSIKEFAPTLTQGPAPTHDPEFQITITPASSTAIAGQQVSFEAKIDPYSNRIDFAKAKMYVTFKNVEPNGNSPRPLRSKKQRIPTPVKLYDLKDGIAEFPFEADVPDQAGNYIIYIHSIGFYDENGDELESIRGTNQPGQALITVR